MKETNFKHTDIGLIPHDWVVKTIESISKDFAYGVGAEAVEFDGVNKYIRITDIDDFSGKYSPSPVVSPSFFYESHLVKENDILIARTGASVGKTYLYEPDDGLLIYAGFLMKINIDNANARYVFYQTKGSLYKSWVIQESARTGQPGLNLEQLKTFQIPFPKNNDEQRRIAEALLNIDQLLDAMDAQIAKKEAIKTGAMQQLLTGKTRLAGFTEPWNEKTIGEMVGKICRGQSLQSKDFIHGYIPVVAGGKQYAGFHNIANHINRTITISGSGANAGYISLHNVPIFATDCSVIDECDNFSLDYIYFLLQFNQANIYKMQTGGAQPHIYPKDVAAIRCNITTSVTEQKAIAEVLSNMDAEIQALQDERNKYALIKQGMMQELLTGKTRI